MLQQLAMQILWEIKSTYYRVGGREEGKHFLEKVICSASCVGKNKEDLLKHGSVGRETALGKGNSLGEGPYIEKVF
jgi:hypothetical protein